MIFFQFAKIVDAENFFIFLFFTHFSTLKLSNYYKNNPIKLQIVLKEWAILLLVIKY